MPNVKAHQVHKNDCVIYGASYREDIGVNVWYNESDDTIWLRVMVDGTTLVHDTIQDFKAFIGATQDH